MMTAPWMAFYAAGSVPSRAPEMESLGHCTAASALPGGRSEAVAAVKLVSYTLLGFDLIWLAKHLDLVKMEIS